MKPYFRNDDKSSTEGPNQLTLTTLTGAFTVLGIGLILASVIFLAEYLFAAYHSHKYRLKVISIVSLLCNLILLYISTRSIHRDSVN